MNLFRTIAMFTYLFGYMIVHYNVLRTAERAQAAGDTATVERLVREHIPHWSRGILKITGVSLTVEGLENIPADRSCVFVCNHRSYYDIPLLLAGLDRPYGLLAKQELIKLPLINRWMKLLGCVFVDREDMRASMRSLNDAMEIVEGGKSFIIFPEGTRYQGEEGGAGEFKQGAFRIAVKTGAPVVPVAISGARGLFESHRCIVTPGRVRIKVLPPIYTQGMSRSEQKQLPAAVRQAILAQL
ncbi:MAG: lysophospholipid acyltransferase family protein [Faecalibacterium sp.]